MQVCAAHSPHQTPLAALYLIRDNRNCPERSNHAWPCPPPLDLEEAAATSVFPLGLLAPAACRVPGELIKFDLFFFPRQSISPPPPPARRPLFCPLRPWGVSDCLSACAQLRAKLGTQKGGVVPQLQVCRGRASQASATLLWPRIYPRSPARAPSLSHPWSRG